MKSVIKNPVFRLCLASLLVCSTLFFQFGCQKDNLAIATEKTHNDFAFTTKDVTVKNGMLAFKDLATFQKVMASLHELAQDTVFARQLINSKKPSNNVTLRDGDDPDLLNSLLQVFGSQFSGYLSLYNAQRSAEDAFLENGGEPEDFHRSFVSDDYFQAVLNASNEIALGEVIFHYVDDYHTWVVLDGNYANLAPVQSAADPLSVPETAAMQLLNVGFQEDNDFYNSIMGLMGPLGGCSLVVGVSITGANSIHAQVFGLANVSEQIEWSVKDANGNFAVVVTTNLDEVDITIPQGTPSPFTLIAKVLSGTCAGDQATRSFKLDPPSCNFDFSFFENSSSVNTFTFFISRQPACCNLSYTWNFGDGTTATSTGSQQVSHTYTDGETTSNRTITVTVNNPAGCTNIVRKAIITGCGIHQSDRDITLPMSSSQKGFATIWMDNKWFYSSVGGKGLFYQKNWLGIWRRTNSALSMQWGGLSPIFFKNCNQQQPLFTGLISRSNSDEVRNEWYYDWTRYIRVTARSGRINCTFRFINNRSATLSW